MPTYSPDPRTAFAENRLLPESAKKAGGRLIPGCWVDPSPAVAGLLRETLDLAREHGIRVLKTSCDGWAGKSSADPASWGRALTRNMERILEYVRAAGAVFQVHTGHDRSHVRLVEKLVRFAGEGITFHLVHLGGCVSGQFYLLPRLREWTDEGLDVVTDTSMASGFAVRWSLRLARTNPAVANRVLFASDAPWGTFESEISKVLATVGSGTTIVRKVLFDNAARVYMTRSSG
ncbi:MAG: amidohydrolase family protein [candidate division WOR-3 bacterium]|nr:MAG: amidohydrolase family protein [candidate division WOR-3 bacterium]